MPALFVDTSAFYAVADESDRHHEETRALFASRGVVGDLKTSDHVFVESWCLIRARLGKAAAMKYWDAMETGVVQVYGVKSEDLTRARRIARAWEDQDFSLVDCTSFAVIERTGIAEALALDTQAR